MKSILFIGGAGFIGFHLTRYFSEKYPDYRLVHLDKLLFPGCLDNVHACRKMPRYFFEHGDASISQRVVKLFQEFDIRGVIMLVATGAFDASVKNLRPVVDSNFLSVFTVLEAARNHWQSTPGVYKLGYDDCRVHFVSTADVYGEEPVGSCLSEEAALSPGTPDAACKASAEMLLQSYMRTYGMNISVSRPTVVYGPGQTGDRFIPMMIDRALSGKSLVLKGKGQIKRDWLYIDDAVRALDLIYHNARPGAVYNVASQKIYADLDILRAVCAVMDIKKPRLNGQKYEQLIRFSADNPLPEYQVSLDLTRIQKDMDWRASELFETGLVKTVASYLK